MIQFYSILKCSIVLFFFVISQTIYAQKNTWVDSLDHRARTEILPAKKYHWTWQNAALLNTIKAQYEIANSEKKDEYLAYIRKAMDRKLWRANGKSPNAVASGLGMAFLARVTGEEKYKRAADKIF
jgi:unsaturated rhamnogalacturonyl hydrolase